MKTVNLHNYRKSLAFALLCGFTFNVFLTNLTPEARAQDSVVTAEIELLAAHNADLTQTYSDQITEKATEKGSETSQALAEIMTGDALASAKNAQAKAEGLWGLFADTDAEKNLAELVENEVIATTEDEQVADPNLKVTGANFATENTDYALELDRTDASSALSFATTTEDLETSETQTQNYKINYTPFYAQAVDANFDDNKALYSEIYPNVDLLKTTYPEGVKEDIILKNEDAQSTFMYALELDGLTPVLADDGGVNYLDASGNVQAYIPAPNLVDADGQTAVGTYQLVHEAGAEKWLTKNSPTAMKVTDLTFDGSAWTYTETPKTEDELQQEEIEEIIASGASDKVCGIFYTKPYSDKYFRGTYTDDPTYTQDRDACYEYMGAQYLNRNHCGQDDTAEFAVVVLTDKATLYSGIDQIYEDEVVTRQYCEVSEEEKDDALSEVQSAEEAEEEISDEAKEKQLYDTLEQMGLQVQGEEETETYTLESALPKNPLGFFGIQTAYAEEVEEATTEAPDSEEILAENHEEIVEESPAETTATETEPQPESQNYFLIVSIPTQTLSKLAYPIDLDPTTFVVTATTGRRTFAPDFMSGSQAGTASVLADKGRVTVPNETGIKTGIIQTSKLIASDGADNDWFGSGVDIDGDQAIFGAESYTAGMGAEKAYYFKYEDGAWVEKQIITPPAEIGEADCFACNGVAVNGNHMMIGANQFNEVAYNAGVVYYYELVDSTWTLTQKISPTDTADYGYFGAAISLDDDKAIIGAHAGYASDSKAGAVYYYKLVDGTWTQQQAIADPVGGTNDFFGSNVSISGDKLLIGAYNDDGAADDGGAVYYYELVDDTWTQQSKFYADAPTASNHFGVGVAMDGKKAMIGSGSGISYYELVDDTWTYKEQTFGTAEQLAAQIGGSLGISGNTIMVGGRKDDNENGTDAGAVYLYAFNLPSGADTKEVTETSPADTTEIWAGLDYSPAGGTVEVYIDGEKMNEISLYNNISLTAQKTLLATGLTAGTHTVQLIKDADVPVHYLEYFNAEQALSGVQELNINEKTFPALKTTNLSNGIVYNSAGILPVTATDKLRTGSLSLWLYPEFASDVDTDQSILTSDYLDIYYDASVNFEICATREISRIQFETNR